MKNSCIPCGSHSRKRKTRILMAHVWGAFLCGACVWNDDVDALSSQPMPVEVRKAPNVT